MLEAHLIHALQNHEGVGLLTGILHNRHAVFSGLTERVKVVGFLSSHHKRVSISDKKRKEEAVEGCTTNGRSAYSSEDLRADC